MREAFMARIRQTVLRHQLFPPGERLVVAVSGGADSVALLHVLRRLQPAWKLALHVAHLDHALRKDSAADAGFVRDLAARWRLPATIERRDVAAICQRQQWSLEDGARRVRYEFLHQVARDTDAGHLVLAHTADDQAETVLMRLLRGTGMLGLSAIPIKRRHETVWIVRPCLEVWRRDILDFLAAEHAAYREDMSNADPRFLRNRIRHQLIPSLEREYNPNIKVALTQLAEQSASDYTYLQDMAARQWRRLVKVPVSSPVTRQDGRAARHVRRRRANGGVVASQGLRAASLLKSAVVAGSCVPADLAVSISVPPFLRQPKALQRQLLRRVILRIRGDLNRFEYRHWLEAERLFLERPIGTLLDLPGGVQLRRERARVVCRRTPSPMSRV